MKALWNFFGGIIAFALCVLLVVSLVLCPMVSFLTDSMEPANLVKIVVECGILDSSDGSAADLTIRLSTEPGLHSESGKSPLADLDFSALENVDLSALEDALKTLADSHILDPEDLMKAVELPEGSQVDEKKLINDLAKSDLVQTLVSAYAGDIMDAAMGIDKDPELTKETVIGLLKPHVSNLVDVVKDSLPEGTKIKREVLISSINTVIEDAMPELVEELPPAQEVAQSVVASLTPEDNAAMQQLLSAFNFIRTGKLRIACILLAAALALLIVLFRLPNLSGLRWVGIAGLFSALLVGGVGFALQSRTVLVSLQQATGNAAALVGELVASLASGFVSFATIYGIAGLILVVAGGVLHAAFARH